MLALQVGCISIVVLGMVYLHGAGVDVRLQGFGSIGQGSLREIQRMAAGGDEERAREGGAGGEEGAAVHRDVEMWLPPKHTKMTRTMSRRKCCVQSFVVVITSARHGRSHPSP